MIASKMSADRFSTGSINILYLYISLNAAKDSMTSN